MTRDNIEALTQIIILQSGSDDEVAHLLTKVLDHDATQREVIAQQAAQIQRLREALLHLHQDSTASDFNEHWAAYQEAEQALKETTP